MLNSDPDVRSAIVITTVNYPTLSVAAIAQGAAKRGMRLIIVGDESSPSDYSQQFAEYFDVVRQSTMTCRLSSLLPLRNYARKNLGYLEAMRGGASVILETDDDNYPEPAFWAEPSFYVSGNVVRNAGWVNCYRYYTEGGIWPRGFPLELVASSMERSIDVESGTVQSPIQQGLANANPDVDAIYRLLMPLPVYFASREPLILSGTSWCPINSQNTTWWRKAFPLMYLPSHCSFRMTDIWRGFVAQRIAAANNWSIAFHGPTMAQDRNPHVLLRDFADEIPSYLHSSQAMTALQSIDIQAGEENLAEGMRCSYEALINKKLIGEEEWPLLESWLDDVSELLF